MRERVKTAREVLFEKQPNKGGNRAKSMSTGELSKLRMKKFVNKQRSKESERFTVIVENKKTEPPTCQRRSGRLALAAAGKPKVEESTRKRRKLPEVEESPLKRRKLRDDELCSEPVVVGLMGKLTSIVGTLAGAIEQEKARKVSIAQKAPTATAEKIDQARFVAVTRNPSCAGECKESECHGCLQD